MKFIFTNLVSMPKIVQVITLRLLSGCLHPTCTPVWLTHTAPVTLDLPHWRSLLTCGQWLPRAGPRGETGGREGGRAGQEGGIGRLRSGWGGILGGWWVWGKMLSPAGTGGHRGLSGDGAGSPVSAPSVLLCLQDADGVGAPRGAVGSRGRGC